MNPASGPMINRVSRNAGYGFGHQGFIGRLDSQKGYDLLLESLVEVLEETSDGGCLMFHHQSKNISTILSIYVCMLMYINYNEHLNFNNMI